MFNISKALEMARKYISACVQEGDFVIDATAGNGYDTLFLARLVGDKGKVISFDIQLEAINNTRQRLTAEKLLHRVDLIHSGHEQIDKYVDINLEISAAMFNLGYLPGGDHNIITKPDTTLKALRSCLVRLKKGGIVTIVIYTGHKGGKEEKTSLLKFCSRLDQKIFTVLHYHIINQVNEPPSLIVIEKYNSD